MTVRKAKKEVLMNRAIRIRVRMMTLNKVNVAEKSNTMVLFVCLCSGNDSEAERDENECAPTSAGKRLKTESSSDDSPVTPAAKKKKKNVVISSDDDFE